ncbi:hypothetical protein [Mucilaginibacter paludis]|uniref:Uncharacterized protein n=1 Tax=Mucilaginibacter paludis DSM 18603 TaxID=714943 RepID=H1YAH7_9SPHI|nr:hypothetical protein [Mucilaginibacter paludis]EHQ27020.1 hypothetical protein Mucpa_2912 [Mucilaginibacter paludis DSM 18603]
MENILTEKLRAYVLENNLDLVVRLQEGYSFMNYLKDKVAAVEPFMQHLILEQKPEHIVVQLCLDEMTRELRPSKFLYIRTVLEEEFPVECAGFGASGVLTYEVTHLIDRCQAIFETFGFSEASADNHLLRHAVIAEMHDHIY